MNAPHIPLEILVDRFTNSLYNNNTLHDIESWMHSNLKKDNAELILLGLKRVFSTFFVRNVKRCEAYTPQELAVLASLLAAFMDCKFWAGFPPSSREASWCELTLGGISIYLIDVLLQTTTINNVSNFARAVYRRIFLLPKSHFINPTNAVRLIALYKWASTENKSFTLTPKDFIENYLDAQSLVTWIEKKGDKRSPALDIRDSSAEKVLETIMSSYELEDFVELLDPIVEQVVEPEVYEDKKRQKQKQRKRLKSVTEDQSMLSGTTSKKRKKLVKDPRLCLKKKKKTKDLSCNDAYSIETLEKMETNILTPRVLQDSYHGDQDMNAVETKDVELRSTDMPNVPEHLEIPSPRSTPDMLIGQESMPAACDSCLILSEPSSGNPTVSPKFHATDSAVSTQCYSPQAQTVLTNGSERASIMTPKKTALVLSQPKDLHPFPFDESSLKEKNSAMKTPPEALQKYSQREPQITSSSNDVISDPKCCTDGPASPKITTVVENYQTGAFLPSVNDNRMRKGNFPPTDQNTPPGGAQENYTCIAFLRHPTPTKDQVNSGADLSNMTKVKVPAIGLEAPKQLKPSATRATRQLRGKSPRAHDTVIGLAESPMVLQKPSLRGRNSPVSVGPTPDKAPHVYNHPEAETDGTLKPYASDLMQKLSSGDQELSSPSGNFKISTPPSPTTPVFRQTLSPATQSKGVHSGSTSPTIGTRKSTVRRQSRSDDTQILNTSHVSDLMTSLQDADVSKSPVITPIKRLSIVPQTIETSLLCGKFSPGGPIQNLTSVVFDAEKSTDAIDEVSIDSLQNSRASGLLTAVPMLNLRSSRTPRSNRRKQAAQETLVEKRRVSLRRRGSDRRTNDGSAEQTDRKGTEVHRLTSPGNMDLNDLDNESNDTGSLKRVKHSSLNRQKRSITPQSIDILPVSSESPVTEKRLSLRRRNKDPAFKEQALTNTPSGSASANLGRSKSAKKKETTPQRQPYLLRGRT